MAITKYQKTPVGSCSKIAEMVIDKYLLRDDIVLLVQAVYGPKLLCVPVDAADVTQPNTFIIEMVSGMQLLDKHPFAVETDDGKETAGPSAREFVFALTKMTENGGIGEEFTLREIADYLDYDYDAVQKRAARLLRGFPRSVIRVTRTGKTNFYSVASLARLKTYLSSGSAD